MVHRHWGGTFRKEVYLQKKTVCHDILLDFTDRFVVTLYNLAADSVINSKINEFQYLKLQNKIRV